MCSLCSCFSLPRQRWQKRAIVFLRAELTTSVNREPVLLPSQFQQATLVFLFVERVFRVNREPALKQFPKNLFKVVSPRASLAGIAAMEPVFRNAQCVRLAPPAARVGPVFLKRFLPANRRRHPLN